MHVDVKSARVARESRQTTTKAEMAHTPPFHAYFAIAVASPLLLLNVASSKKVPYLVSSSFAG